VNNQAHRAYAIADEFRRRNVTVVMGGLHATALPQEAAAHADAVCIGEGEGTFPAFLADWREGKVRQFYHSPGWTDLTRVPMPRYDLIPHRKRFNKICIQASRGCPRDCEFCSVTSIFGSNFRTKTSQQVVKEIETIKQLFPDPFISFADENLFVDRDYGIELVDALRSLNVRWEAYCDIGVYRHRNLLSRLADSGCVQLLIGLESIDPVSMAQGSAWKSRMVNSYREAVAEIQSHGVGVMGLFIIGFDHDDPGVFSRIADFCEETGLFDMDVAILTPIPGTRIFSRLKSAGRLTSENWDHYTWYHVNFTPALLSARQIQDGIMWLFSRFNTPERMARRKAHFNAIHRRLQEREAALVGGPGQRAESREDK